MSRDNPIDRDTAERMLRGVPAGPRPVAEALGAAAAPARESELAGETAALTAFREASRDAAAVGLGARVRAFFPARMATAMVGAAAAGLALVIGISAFSGALPDPLGVGYGRDTTASPSTTRSGKVTRPGQPGAKPPNTEDEDTFPAHPSPSMAGLCRAYQAGLKGPQAKKMLDTPAFRSLVAAAGGKNKVPAYCAAVLDSKKNPRSGGGGPGKPKDHDDRGSKGDKNSGRGNSAPESVQPPVPPLAPHVLGSALG